MDDKLSKISFSISKPANIVSIGSVKEFAVIDKWLCNLKCINLEHEEESCFNLNKSFSGVTFRLFPCRHLN